MANRLNSGSVWHRWDPHVHAPGTLLNDQFQGTYPWEEYLSAIETAQPHIRALGVTDYYLTDAYERVLQKKLQGRLERVELIFPNVEMRLDVGTVRGRWVNVHLLVSPEDPEHLTQLRRLLARFRFRAHGDAFSCTPDDLIRLGMASDPSIVDSSAALRHGAAQYKVGFDTLREEFEQSRWAQENILVAIASGETDGTSGVRSPADATLREEIEAFAHVIFASSRAQREFWLGQRAATEEHLRARFGGLKPCLHGSDCHDHSAIGAPYDGRYSWVKGALEFDALRQACIDPSDRAFVGLQPPEYGAPSQSISSIRIRGATWVATPLVPLNAGLVAIIGPRGSGKTALADMIAMGCDAIRERSAATDAYPSPSFLSRASDLLRGADVTIDWRSGEPITRALDGSTTPTVSPPRARYLSQQFVEELCSSTGMTDELLREIERVIFESHPISDRDGALDFDELLEMRASRHHQARRHGEEAMADLSDRIGTELEKDRQLEDLTRQIELKRKQIRAYAKDREKLIAKGGEDRARRFAEVAAAAEKVRGYVRFFNAQEQALLALKDEVRNLRENQAPEMLRSSQERHAASRMKPEEWKPFLIDYTGDVDGQLSKHLDEARASAASWKGTKPQQPADPQTALIGGDAELDRQPLALLEAEIERLQKLINADEVAQRQFVAISGKITKENTELDVLLERFEDAKGAKDRAKALQADREAAYHRVFEAILAEQAVLTELYEPLLSRLAEAEGTLGKLRFTVYRTADVAGWSQVIEEELVDLRRQGPFRGRGNFQGLAEAILKTPWENGNAAAVSQAMNAFRDQYQEDLLEHSVVPKANHANYRSWLKRFARWLFSTDHIQLYYGITYDGIEIGKLSPGTRGIVLLLLYLALDDADDRPLIIDQPEENLDPQSVFDELVSLFIAAKTRRQVIIVTHNANLVVNTDADQIIVASSGPHARGELPVLSYESGGIESTSVRRAVCDILEGGERAFKERARRLRVALPK